MIEFNMGLQPLVHPTQLPTNHKHTQSQDIGEDQRVPVTFTQFSKRLQGLGARYWPQDSSVCDLFLSKRLGSISFCFSCLNFLTCKMGRVVYYSRPKRTDVHFLPNENARDRGGSQLRFFPPPPTSPHPCLSCPYQGMTLETGDLNQ